MKHWIALLLLVACAGAAESPEADADEKQQGIASIQGLDDSSWGVDVTPTLPYEKCKVHGSSTQDCRFVKPYAIGDGGNNGMPTRYKIAITGSPGGAWPSTGPGSFSAVQNTANDVATRLSQQLQLPQLSSPVIVDFTFLTSPVNGVNITAGTLPVGGNTTRTDTFMTLTFASCGSALNEIAALPGTYRECSQANVTIDFKKLALYYSGTQLALNTAQLVAHGIVSGLGAGRQESVQGYPSNRAFNDQEAAHGGGVYLTGDEYKQLRCIGFTFSGPLLAIVPQPCGH